MLISQEYKALNAKLHADVPEYGISGQRWARDVVSLAKKCRATSILDYGCGKGTLKKSLKLTDWGEAEYARYKDQIFEYDPCIEGKDALPEPADFVVCGDVLEHIEPEFLDAVLDDLERVTRRIGYLVIYSGPSRKKLSDGRNTHLIQEPMSWWVEKLEGRFVVAKIERWNSQDGDPVFVCVVEAKAEAVAKIADYVGEKHVSA